jgi:starch synthase
MVDMPTKHPLIHVWFLAAEAEPFVKIGGLGDVAGSLPKAINLLEEMPGYVPAKVNLVIPYHTAIREKNLPLDCLGEYTLAHLPDPIQITVYRSTAQGLVTYLLDSRPPLFNQRVYTSDDMVDGNKYLAFSAAALQLPSYLNEPIDILHANDWHTAFAVYAMKNYQKRVRHFRNAKSILTLHNLPYMGHADAQMLASYGLYPSRSTSLPVWARNLPLPLGLSTANQVVPVSEGYAKEILTPEYGCGLVTYLNTRRETITGIINGIDTDIWNPETDQHLAARFGADTIEKRLKNKKQIQKMLGLPNEPGFPLLVTVSRFDRQKGIDLILDGLPQIKGAHWQSVLLGTGDPTLERQAMELAGKYPDHIRVITRFDNDMAHLLYSGGDIFMMPSRYEPCGLSQMIAMRYGCVPLARETGGLMDTIHDARKGSDGTGFLFTDADPLSFAAALQECLETFQDTVKWKKIQLNGMSVDFSWKNSAQRYLQLYNQLCDHPSSDER